MRKIALVLSLVTSILGMSLASINFANAADLTPVPTVSLSVSVGSTLVANPGDSWDSPQLSYQWYKNDAPISGATNSSYKATGGDYLGHLYVQVSGTYQSAPLTTKSAPVTVAAGALTLKPTPTISGTGIVGSVLTANAGTWDAGVTLSYQWLNNGFAIPNATFATYKLPAADFQKSIAVKVTGSSTGYSAETTTSSSVVVGAGSLNLKPSPAISGTPTVGSVLTANAGTWDAGVLLSYQWFSNGTAIANAASSTYTLVAADFQKAIYVKVTGSATGYSPRSTTSSEVVVGALSLVPSPTISGTATVGSVLTVIPGTWDEGVVLSYQWFGNGTAIDGAVASTYTLLPVDFQKSISVKVTGSANNYASETTSSSAVSVSAASLSLKPAPTLSGSNAVGSVLTATAGTWDAGVSVSYQWFSNGTAISKATSDTYTLLPVDFQKAITVKVTGSAPGYTSETTTSASVTVAAAALTLKSSPTISGSTAVGSVVTANPGTWDSGVSFTYQWLSDGGAIARATSASYTLAAADFQKLISVRVTGSAAGYTSASTTSTTFLVTVGSLTLKPEPAISGSKTVGSVLSAVAGVWDTGVTVGYQWFRNDVAIENATSSSYTLLPRDFQKSITVKVTGSAAGYNPETTSSAAVTVAAGSLNLKAVPSLAGSNTVGSVLTANPGTWDAGVELSYQWFSDDVAIENATSSKYTLLPGDFQKSISVRVTGSAVGYLPETTSSSAVQVGVLTLKPVPTVSGSASVGSVLMAVAGTWDAGVSISYQWYNAGKAIAHATLATYTLLPSDLDQLVSVVVTGSAAGYASVHVKSYPVTVKAGLLSSTRPTITGAIVGSVLTAVAGAWTPGTTFTYQWLNDGSAIPNATSATYTFAAANTGHELSVAVTGNLAGYSTLTVSSLAIMPSAIPFTPCSSKIDTSAWLSGSNTQPAISGVGNVGATLKATTGSWAAGTSFCIYWYADGKAIKGAVSKSYKVQPEQLNQNLQFVLIGTDPLGNSQLRYSQFLPITNADFVNPAPWTITGQARVGYKLGVTSTKSWAMGVTYTYQWLRNGEVIAGATDKTYYATQADLGAKLSVRVCGVKLYYNKLCMITDNTAAVIPGRVTK